MKKMKVLMIAYNNLGKGGIQNQIVNIIRSLKDQVDFDVVVWDNVRDYYRAELESYNVRIIECYRNIGSNLLRRKADAFIRFSSIEHIINDVIQQYGPYDVIHCNNAYDAAPCLVAAYNNGIPVRISHAHNMESPELKRKKTYPAYRLLYMCQRKIIRKYATDMIGCSRQVSDYFFGKGIGNVVHVGVDLSDYDHSKVRHSRENQFKLLHVGSMCYQKNQLFLVEIMKELTAIRTDVHMTLVGGGTEYQENVEKKIIGYNLTDYIDIKSPETEISSEMADADLFIFPSTFEGFGIVLIEAQASELKCFVSKAVTNEANCGGLYFIPLEKGSKGWARRIDKYIECGKSKRKYDVSQFTVDNLRDNILKIYRNNK